MKLEYLWMESNMQYFTDKSIRLLGKNQYTANVESR
uniref:Uncharacterized protein n=1 Tax=Solanum lycopersicum TaxID=4081 RepID=A0A3Q7H7W1_SOLLC